MWPLDHSHTKRKNNQVWAVISHGSNRSYLKKTKNSFVSSFVSNRKRSSLVAQQVKDPVLSLLGRALISGPRLPHAEVQPPQKNFKNSIYLKKTKRPKLATNQSYILARFTTFCRQSIHTVFQLQSLEISVSVVVMIQLLPLCNLASPTYRMNFFFLANYHGPLTQSNLIDCFCCGLFLFPLP